VELAANPWAEARKTEEPAPPPSPVELESREAPRPVAENAATDGTAGAIPNAGDLSELMQGRIHETLEKVAWEAFADLSDSIVRQVLERVERVAWEVIPQMAETLVREEIRRMKGEVDD
jgi:hypothetical protein